jgi:hypothetical protein
VQKTPLPTYLMSQTLFETTNSPLTPFTSSTHHLLSFFQFSPSLHKLIVNLCFISTPKNNITLLVFTLI